MAAALLGILGQVSPAANTDTALYGPGSLRRAVISTVVICNTNATPVTYRVYARAAGAAAGTGNEVASDVEIAGNDSDAITWGITLGGAAGDVLSVRASATGVTFTAFGNEDDIA